MESQKIKYYHEFLNVDVDHPEPYLILVEIICDVPIRSHLVKFPPVDFRFKISPYVYN